LVKAPEPALEVSLNCVRPPKELATVAALVGERAAGGAEKLKNFVWPPPALSAAPPKLVTVAVRPRRNC